MSKMKLAIAVLVGTSVVAWAEDRDRPVAVKVLAVKNQEVVVQPIFTPDLVMSVKSGKPEAGAFLTKCQQENTERAFRDHSETVVILRCEGGVELEVKGIRLQ